MIIIILFFAVTSAVCVQLFVHSARTSTDSADLNYAVIHAQSAAEAVKATEGDMRLLRDILGGVADGSTVYVYYDASYEPTVASSAAIFRLSVIPRLSEDNTLLTADISVEKLGEELYNLTVSKYLGGAKGGV